MFATLFSFFHLTPAQWLIVVCAAVVIGFSKTGIGGVTLFLIPVLAQLFGGKTSTGIILPMLIIGDIFAVKYYHRHADWGKIRRLLPWTIIGVCLGIVVGGYVNDQQFKWLIAVSILICLIILVYMEIKGDALVVPNKPWLYILTGVAAGFTSMIGNAAGPIISIYLLAMGFRKQDFMGTNAWFFLLLNVIKLPLQIFFWKNITWPTLGLSMVMIPAITVGAFLGVYVIKKINERLFKYAILVMTAVVAVKLML